MTGELAILVVVLLLATAFALIAWLVYQNTQISKSAHQTSVSMLELVEKQAALIASKDALAYQAIRAVDTYGSYDDGSTTPDIEEYADGTGADGYPAGETGFDGDPFVAGNIFEQKGI